ncbi:MAG TPA: FosX/FosE/FosI family fosfomycin resistance hydrolase [Selenomonadales bacterium]|nr:FosX/FosE/FosI family fosfomycin resistance hydrolase [Selenomonadales bacterium]
MISGLSHLTFIVRDLERTSDFLRTVFAAEEVYASGDDTFSLSREKYFLIAGQWVCIMEGNSLPERTYNHVAFAIPDEEFENYEARVRAAGVDIRPSRPRIEEEGRSLYFYDYDNHLFELHAGTLEARLDRYTRRR